jgi:hypothetical protein
MAASESNGDFCEKAKPTDIHKIANTPRVFENILLVDPSTRRAWYKSGMTVMIDGVADEIILGTSLRSPPICSTLEPGPLVRY